jgi:hypothetical protein
MYACLQATVQFRVREHFTFVNRTESKERVKSAFRESKKQINSDEKKDKATTRVMNHMPIWVLLKSTSEVGTAIGQDHFAFGGWKLLARLQDAAAPSGVGTEVGILKPPAMLRARMDEIFEATKALAVEDRVTFKGLALRWLLGTTSELKNEADASKAG